MFALQRKQWKIICQRGHQSAGLKQQRQRNELGHMVKDTKKY